MTVNVVGTWLKADGTTPENGKVSFRPSLARFVSISTGAVRPATTFNAILDSAGHISINLPPTDDSDIQDGPFFYIVTVSVTSQTYQFELTVPTATSGSLNIGAQTPTTPRDRLLSRVFTVNGVFPDANGNVTVSGGGGGGSYVPLTDKGAAGGVATLDGSTLVPTTQIPNLDAAKITSGTLNVARVPDMDAAKINSGTLASARIPDLSATYLPATQKHAASGVASLDGSGNLVEPVPAANVSGVLATGNIPSLDAAKVTTGTFNTARIPDLSATYVTVGSTDSHTMVTATHATTGVTSTTFVDVTDLGLPVVAGAYEFSVYTNFVVTQNSGTNVLVAMTLDGPSASFFSQRWVGETVQNGVGTTTNNASATLGTQNANGTTASFSPNVLVGMLNGYVVFTASGTAQVRVKINASAGAPSVTVNTGGVLILRKVA